MGRKSSNGEVNKSAAIRELLKEQPKIKASEAVAALSAKGIKVAPGLFYLVKGKVAGRKSRRRKVQRNAVKVAVASGNSDAVATILKVKKLAVEVGGLRALRSLVEALSD